MHRGFELITENWKLMIDVYINSTGIKRLLE